jgi:hypothetical protein
LIEYASEHISEEIMNDLLRLFKDLAENDQEFIIFMIGMFMRDEKSTHLNDPYVKIASWILG